jgi:ATP-binding protein involved in chromosome partitioning
MLGLRGQPLRLVSEGLKPASGPQGLAVQSMDFFLQGTQPLEWDGPEGEGAPFRSALEAAALGDLLGQTVWGELRALVVDLAPGGDRLPLLRRLLRRRLSAIAVTIPTEVSMLAVERSVRRAREARVPLIGLVENMGNVVCGRCGELGPLFQEAPVEERAKELDLEIIARIPFDPALAAAGDAGRPFVTEAAKDDPAVRAFETLAARVASFDPTDGEVQ